MVSCPDCGSPVREDLLPEHALRCSKRPAGVGAPLPLTRCPECGTNVRQDILPLHVERCRAKCEAERLRAEQAARPVQPASQQIGELAVPSVQELPSQPYYDKGHRLTTCPYCGKLVKQRRYERHLEICSGQREPDTPQPAPTSAQLAVPSSASPPVPPQPAAPQTPSICTPEDDRTRTLDGYTIDKCWDCGRRICLVGTRVYDVAPGPRKGEPHLCDGARPIGRRTKLIYPGSRSVIEPALQPKRGPRKR